MHPTATKLFPFLLLSFPDFYNIFRLFRIGPAVPKLISFIFVSFPDLSGILTDVSGGDKTDQFHVRVISVFFLLFPTFSAVFWMHPTATKLFPFLFLSFPDFYNIFRLFRIGPAVTKLISFMFVSFPDLSGFF